MTKPIVLATLLAANILASCAGTRDSPQTAEEFFAAYRDAYCDNIGECCRASRLLYVREQCRKAFPLPATSLEYDAAMARTCLDGIKSAAAACTTVSDDASAACDRAFHGKKRSGETCQSPWDCAPPPKGFSACRGTGIATAACHGVRTDVKEGEPCDASSSGPESALCAKGLYCDEQRRCATRHKEGEQCSASPSSGSYTCNDGLVCEDACVARGEGEPCSQDLACGYGLSCNEHTCSCQKPKKAGASCTKNQECQGLCVCGQCVGPNLVSEDRCHGPAIEFGEAWMSCDTASPVDAGIARCAPLTPEQNTCRNSTLGGRSDACKLCACTAGNECPAALEACDSDCWSLFDCIAQHCPDFASMAASNDFSCLTENCSAYVGAASLLTAAAPCVRGCGGQCAGDAGGG